MFVVRVENDEATVYRAFRRFQRARAWASERVGDEPDCVVDIFEAADSDDAASAVAFARKERSRSAFGGEGATASPSFPPVSDIAFGRSVV